MANLFCGRRTIALGVLIGLSGWIIATDAATAQEPAISRILFGSCIKQDQPLEILDTVIDRSPELFVFLGDNIYADTLDMGVMRKKYATLKAQRGMIKLLKSCPVLATWDDHDYGANDGGADYPKRLEAQQVFLDFWDVSEKSPRRTRAGVYDAKVFGPAGKRVQVILLDTRYFRGPLKTGERRIGGPYVPSDDPSITMLGDEQWVWLEQQLRQPAEVRLIASGIQCVSEAAGHETWANLPHERQRLFDLIDRTDACGAVLISGDRHWAELSVETHRVPYPMYDLTSSSLNQIHPRGTPTANRHRALPTTYHRENFGELVIDWDSPQPSLALRILDLKGHVQLEASVPLRNFCRNR